MRLGIAGAGIMGANHARLAATIRDVSVAYIADPDHERASRLAATVGATPVEHLGSVADAIDAAIVAAPNELHLSIAEELAKAGVHLLVEKPLAPSVRDAERLVEAAENAGVTLMVGHVERFNPAVLELDHILGDVVHVSAERISPFAPRIRDGVVTDLMIHDLDIVRSIVGSPVTHVEGVARRVRSGTDDLASVVLGFENGVTADLTASRIGQQKIRELKITQVDCFVNVDLVKQDITINRVEHSEFLSGDGVRYRQSGMVEIPFLEHRGEPLLLELQEFVRAVSTGSAPRVGGRDGIEVLRLVEMIERRAHRG